ncbi:MAG: flagellar motor protein [Pseudomonadota bacterium]
MDYIALLGLLVGISAIIGGQFLEGGALSALINGPAVLIVLGGTLGATILQSPFPVFTRALASLKSVFGRQNLHDDLVVKKIISWSQIVRKEGLLGLEGMLDIERDPFTAKGLMLLVDGNEPDIIRDVMELEIQMRENAELEAAKVFQAMGGYSPTIGIIGAVIGLIHVMYNLTDPAKLGIGVATAFVATIYGVGLANLVFLPIAQKLRSRAQAQARFHEMIVEGLVSIAEGENPRYIEMKLRTYQQF